MGIFIFQGFNEYLQIPGARDYHEIGQAPRKTIKQGFLIDLLSLYEVYHIPFVSREFRHLFQLPICICVNKNLFCPSYSYRILAGEFSILYFSISYYLPKYHFCFRTVSP